MAQTKSPFEALYERYEREGKLRDRRRAYLFGGEDRWEAHLREIALWEAHLRAADLQGADPREEAGL